MRLTTSRGSILRFPLTRRCGGTTTTMSTWHLEFSSPSNQKGIRMDPISTLKDISALVKKYNDLELMKQIVDLHGEVFELQQDNLRLQRELADLQSSTEAENAMVSRPPLSYYYRGDDPVPFCPTCWEHSRKQIHLPPSEPWNGGIRRDCRVCKQTYWEKPMSDAPQRIQVRGSNWP